MTATPKNTIHQSTYTFFDMKNNIPTDVYEYEEAVEKDHVLVPFYLIETSTQISDDGITYADLDEEEREAYEAEFVEDGGVPEHIPPERINKYIFNVDTVDRMISDLMNNGIRHKNGNHVGKTIIFAQNKLHAKFIVDRFNELYPQYKGNFCKLVVCNFRHIYPGFQHIYSHRNKRIVIRFFKILKILSCIWLITNRDRCTGNYKSCFCQESL